MWNLEDLQWMVEIDKRRCGSNRLQSTPDATVINCIVSGFNVETEEISQILDLLPLHTPTTTTTIICGEFNARMGNFTGDTRTNAAGRQVLNWMAAHDLILWNQRFAYGEPTSYTFQGTNIIDFFFSNQELGTPTLRIRDNLSLNFNHKCRIYSSNFLNVV
ncbi:hypothetical protein G6F57_016388 [Rhizopus arrhizus]|uniref:Endonuclease/exonuclease/phosphatase domain-containing protein n=1 Tax=Rhizopus oryzae TaxID=64495 RepID=A0A9P6WVH3_RHIOR|nr:hypothetical protein G6F24_013969 [Rhizopus arrhizus]KAG0769479.1 hypothetical protein G6F22_017360 [Rhizopus arrhizus]KAG0777729.1 hypothetical protein G6F21_013252 [Rhizopus arrhizus]KAG0804838.1 hypothetical protein G6F20_012380 [Rhizopus arrhizus]KAG0818604.1 hypothetical protein G6F18_012822 [Rhizopus arrhizus]